jgi:hypothetical protein
MDSSVSPKDEIGFQRVCHHISNAVYWQCMVSWSDAVWCMTVNWIDISVDRRTTGMYHLKIVRICWGSDQKLMSSSFPLFSVEDLLDLRRQSNCRRFGEAFVCFGSESQLRNKLMAQTRRSWWCRESCQRRIEHPSSVLTHSYAHNFNLALKFAVEHLKVCKAFFEPRFGFTYFFFEFWLS